MYFATSFFTASSCASQDQSVHQQGMDQLEETLLFEDMFCALTHAIDSRLIIPCSGSKSIILIIIAFIRSTLDPGQCSAEPVQGSRYASLPTGAGLHSHQA
jgi:hypothetical protein